TYYQPCDSLKPNYEGEKVHPNPQLQPGKFGQAFLMEQRWSLNVLKDPTFEGAPADAWVLIGSPQRLTQGGWRKSGCFQIDSANYLRQAVDGLKKDKLHCLSVYAKSPDAGQLVLSATCGGETAIFESKPLTADYQRLHLSFRAKSVAATVTLRGKDGKKVVIAAAQLDSGRSWPRDFLPETNKPAGTEWVDIPARPEIFNPMKGAIAFWLLPKWLDGESDGGMAFFNAQTTEPAKDYASRKNFISIGAYRRPGKKGYENALNVSFRDSEANAFGYMPIDFDKNEYKPGEWMHVVVTWNIIPGQDSTSECFINGKKAGVKQFRGAAIAPPQEITMGYSGGAYADGLMDDFYIFNRPLTADEAAALYTLGKPLK
ncbi:MAG TPA: hypothetical protein P5137_13025, partial [Candidatus Brocadiia bacterium]|nr:hypothetical protein [Candidatus Brocadiia bacterium]